MSFTSNLDILIIIDSLNCGGAEKSLVSLLPFLAKRGYDITLMLLSRGGLFEQYVPNGVKMVDFPYTSSKRRLMWYSLVRRLPWNKKKHPAEVYWKHVGRFLPSLNKEFDIAIAYQQGFPTFYVADKVKAGKKFSWANADLKGVGYSPEFFGKFYKKFDKIIAVSDSLREKVIIPVFVKDSTKVLTVWDILNTRLIREMSKENKPFVKTPGVLDLVTVGRLVPLKGYDLAIEAACILKERGISFVWHFVGEGLIEKELRAKIAESGLEDCVILEGEQANPYVYIANCDIYVQTSRFEGFGLTVAEAKILGKPVVSTNFEVVHNQIRDGENGLIVEMTGDAIADGIMQLADNSELREKIMENVKREVNSTAKTESEKVISLIEEE